MKTSAPLSKVQFGLYVECVAHQGDACYNLPYLYVLDGTLDEERLRKAIDPAILAESNHALRIFSLSFIPFCYIYVVMIVYKLYAHHRMALFISFALSLTVIPVLWLVSKFVPSLLWYSYLIAYIIEIAAILVLHHVMHAKFELSTKV